MGRLKLIVGTAGSGKTHRILGDVARQALESPFPSETHPPLLVIVPEQEAMQTERAVYQRMGELSGRPAASARINVMGFSRLAKVLRDRSGQGYRPLGELGRRLLVWQLLGRKDKAKAEVFAGLIGELAQNGVEPGSLDSIEIANTEVRATGMGGDSAPPLLGLQNKLNELASVYADYSSGCVSRGLDFLHPTCGIESLLSEENWQYLAQTEVWIDGFLGLTAPEERAIRALLTQCETVSATVLIDPAQIEKQDYNAFADWFKPTRELYGWWEKTASELGAPCEVERLAGLPRWKQTSPLGSLAMVRDYSGSGQTANGFAEAVACGDDRSEVDYAARKIVELVTTQGYSYNEISIITRDISPYAGFIKARFDDHDIPTFIDERRKLESHPAVVLFLSGLKVALGINQPGDAQALLKTELLPGAENTNQYRNEISLLEQAYVALGKRPTAWLSSAHWDVSSEGLDELRQTILAPILELSGALQNLGEGRKTCQKVLGLAWEHLLPNRVASLLGKWAESQDTENPVEAQVHRGVLNEIVKTLDALVEISGNEFLSPGELCGWLEFSFGQLTLGAPPPVLDSVLVTDIERGRHHPVKAVIILGMAADTWPHQHKESPYLNDAERRELCSSAGRVLGDGASGNSAKEPYFAMVAATRPSHNLALTRPSSDSQGKGREPSIYYTHFCKLLTLTEITFSSRGENACVDSIASFNDLALASSLQGKHSGLSGLVGELGASSACSIDTIAASNWYEGNAKANQVDLRLSPAVMDTLLPGPAYAMSASRLENFASCPFKHFAHYYLGLEENSEPALDALALGSFYHDVLQRIVEALIRQGYGWVSGDIAEFKRVGKAVLAQQKEQLKKTTGRERTALIHTRAQTLLELHARLISNSGGEAGRFPVGVEVAFGDKPGNELPAVRLPIGKGELVLRGMIDRVDLGADGSASVVDYKLGAKDVDWQLFLAGAQIQLPLYLMAVDGQSIRHPESSQTGLAMKASAASYAAIEAKWEKDEATLITHSLLGKPSKKVSETADDCAENIQALITSTKYVVGEIGQRILDGEYAPLPLRQAGSGKFNACTFCSFAPVCRFDPLAGNPHRETDRRSKKELFEKLTKEGGYSG